MPPTSTFRKPGSSALRKGRTSLPGQIYLVTFTTCHRSRLFEDPELARMVCVAQRDPRIWLDSTLLAWVLMPDHWHGLIQLGSATNLSRLVQRLKSNTARTASSAGTVHDVWDKGFHDRALRASDDVRAAARYVIGNPVRAGLVRQPGLYPYWDAVWLQELRDLRRSHIG